MISIQHDEQRAIVFVPEHPGPIEVEAEDYCYLLQLLYPGVLWRYSRATENKEPILIGWSYYFGLSLIGEFSALLQPQLAVYPITAARDFVFDLGALLFAQEIGALARLHSLGLGSEQSLASTFKDCLSLAHRHTPGPVGPHVWKSQDARKATQI